MHALRPNNREMRYPIADPRRRRAALALAWMIPWLLGAQDPPPRPEAPPKADPIVAELVEAHNRERAKEKLPPLKLDARLEGAARSHAKDMADRDVMSHEGGDGSTPAQRVTRAGYHYQTTGENVAQGYRDVASVMQGWMDSPPHRKNIMGDFTEIGVARVEGKDDKPYWSAEFGKPIPKLDPTAAASDLVKRINDERSAAQLGALAADPGLGKPAEAVAAELARGKEGKAPSFDGVEQKRYQDLAMTISSGQPDPETLVKGLLQNPDYKARLLGKYSRIGVGYATGEDGIPHWCVILGLPANR